MDNRDKLDERYNHTAAEKRQRAFWENNPIGARREGAKKFYCLDMFPYPSGSGLHVGHWRGYVLSDVVSRQKILQGFNVLHPMGWDAFGLPAENYAIKTGVHPEKLTRESIATYKRQLMAMAAVYDWDRELATIDEDYYKWTQYIFVKMFNRGLAYEKEMPLNWCPTCKAVLANEEASGGVCERCGAVTEKKNLRQWMLKITQYAERLLEDLDALDWPEKVKKMQADWIGRSSGAEVDFAVVGSDVSIRVYTTRPDTLFGATFIVLSPEHELAAGLAAVENKQAVDTYIKAAGAKSNVDRMAGKDKTGEFIGAYAANPVNGQNIPIWISDYVLADYGTGAIMCVPAHDERDFEFATKFNIPIIQVIEKPGNPWDEKAAYTEDGVLINSGEFSGLDSTEGKERVTAWLEEKCLGKATINYKLRDWVFSRQRYWGEPIPLIHCEKCGVVPVPEEDLPVTLPHVENYKPTDTGESPLALIESWVNVKCPVCGGAAKRETNTMPQWAGSSWYFLRYADNKNKEELIGKEGKAWLPVDYYVGGIEHAVLHLLYARFYTKVLFDEGLIDFTEPFTKLFNQGTVNYGGRKMSKSEGNVVSPDEMIEKYGCDALRLYILFISPPELACEWDERGLEGVYRFIGKAWRLVAANINRKAASGAAPPSKESEYAVNKLIFDITQRLENLNMNTAVSAFMEFVNTMSDLAKANGGVDDKALKSFAVLLAPFTPHLAEEIWAALGGTSSVFCESWPLADDSKLQRDTVNYVLQINGKNRGQIEVSTEDTEQMIKERAAAHIADRLINTNIRKTVFVKGRLINFVVEQQKTQI